MNTEEALYTFDLQGFVVLPGVLAPEVVERALKVVESNTPRIPAGSVHQINAVHELDPVFEEFIDVPDVVALIAATSAGTWRLNHTYALVHEPPNRPTPLHGGSSFDNIALYETRHGRILSTLTKAVFPLVDCGAADGCFGAIPGSHKAGLPRPEFSEGTAHPLVRPVEARSGDCVVFTEALCHGSVPATSEKHRRGLYYCYSAGWMRDWPEMGFTEEWANMLTPERREVVRLKGLD